MSRAARALAIAIAGGPWLVLLPIGGVFAVVAHAIAFAAAFHGWGLVVAARTRVPAFLAIQWGIALVVALSGIAIALRIDTATLQATLVFVGVAIHSATFAIRARAIEPLVQLLREARWWIVPVAMIAIVGGLAVVGAAGDVAARPFDDDGNVLGQIRGLADTGALGDPVGAPRFAQLGGTLGLLGLISVVGDLHAVHLLDALGSLLVLGLACTRIGPRTAHAGLWMTLLVVVAVAMPYAIDDPAPAWLAVGLILALFASIADGAPPRAIGLLAGALITLRLELAPIAIVALVIASASARDRRRVASLLGAAALVVVPYVVARAMAWATVGGAVRRLIHGGAFGSYSARFAWPIAIALFVILVIELARRGRTRSLVAFVVVLVSCVLVQAGQTGAGRFRWTRRALDLVDGVAYERVAQPPPTAARYTRALAAVPPGATVAIWVLQPEAIDHARNPIIDVRGPRISKERLAALLEALHVGYLLVENDPTIAPETSGLRVIRVSP